MKYQYYFCTYASTYVADKNNWNAYDFAILYDDQLIGSIRFEVNRPTWRACDLVAVNFSENKISFGIALKQIIDDIFVKYNFNKINFSVVVGNPIESTYDRMVDSYNGHIIGIKRKQIKVQDGSICDLKLYEILKEEYMTRINYINKKRRTNEKSICSIK